MSSAESRPDPRVARHRRSEERILAVAWSLARERGLAGWSLREIAEGVGIRTPSLYVYFDSKNSLYDAMFADGYRALLGAIAATPTAGPPAEVLRRAGHVFFDFCVADPARFQLLFLRTLPGFTPSPDSYALAQTVLVRLTEVLEAAGRGSAEQVDLWTAFLTGLASQQISNDPGGDRWARLVDPAVVLLIAAPAPATT